MKFFKYILIIILFTSLNSFSQKVIKHKIVKGQSIYELALKYDVTEKEIYELNPKAKGSLLQLNQVIRIPNKKYKEQEKKAKKVKKENVVEKNETKEINNTVVEKETFINHKVGLKETLYSISKKYNVTMETICELNPELKVSNLKAGSKLKIPNPSIENITKDETQNSSTSNEENLNSNLLNSTGDVIHKVLPKETLFRISKQYGTTVAELEKLNPGIENGLPIDYDLIVKKGNTKQDIVNTEITIPLKEPEIDVKNIPAGNLAKAEFLIGKAAEHLGTRYRSGGTTSAGYDCSGLMYSTFKNIDMTLPRSSYEMATYGVRINKAHAQKGDLIFFATFGRGRVSHVGMITEILDDEIKFIHSSTQSGVIVSSTKEPYYSRTFVQINRVITD